MCETSFKVKISETQAILENNCEMIKELDRIMAKGKKSEMTKEELKDFAERVLALNANLNEVLRVFQEMPSQN